MISDHERKDVWTFLDNCGVPVTADVTVVSYPGQQGRSAVVCRVTFDGRTVSFENGKYVWNGGTELPLPHA